MDAKSRFQEIKITYCAEFRQTNSSPTNLNGVRSFKKGQRFAVQMGERQHKRSTQTANWKQKFDRWKEAHLCLWLARRCCSWVGGGLKKRHPWSTNKECTQMEIMQRMQSERGTIWRRGKSSWPGSCGRFCTRIRTELENEGALASSEARFALVIKPKSCDHEIIQWSTL